MSKLLLKQAHAEILPKEDSAYAWNPQQGGADAEAEALRQKVLNAEDHLVITGATYYISPTGDDANDGTTPETAWKTVDAVMAHDDLIKAGDGVLFERGGVYRSQITLDAESPDLSRGNPPLPTVIYAKSGVSYGAYGKGPKPAIYGSFKNYAWEACWEATEYPNIWKVETPYSDCGVVVFNHGEQVGVKRFMKFNIQSITDLKENFEFYHDFVHGVLYLYLDKGCPHDLYEDIELCVRGDFMQVPPNTENVTVDNLAIKYFGHYGVEVKINTKNITFTNCEIGWIGGCEWVLGLCEGLQGHPFATKGTRIGNGIEFWHTAENALMENNWIYQIYDAGLSPQGGGNPKGGCFRNVVMRGNLLEYNTYNIEFFHHHRNTVWDGYYIEDNIMRFAGYGWGRQRPDPRATAHLNAWTYVFDLPLRIYIRNNILDCSDWNAVFWCWTPDRAPENMGATISGNTFYEKESSTGKAIAYSVYGQNMANNQEDYEEAVKVFDPNPKLVKWLP